MPNRSRSGPVSSPVRVVAPTSVKHRQLETNRSRGRALADDDVEHEVLHRGIEDLFDRTIEAVDLVDEQDVARFEVGENRGEVAGALDGGPARGTDAHAELVGDDLRQRRLAQAGRSRQQQVVERLVALPCRLDQDRQVLLHPRLAEVLVEPPRTQRTVDLQVILSEVRRDETLDVGSGPSSRRAESASQIVVTSPTPVGGERAGAVPAHRLRHRRRP